MKMSNKIDNLDIIMCFMHHWNIERTIFEKVKKKQNFQTKFNAKLKTTWMTNNYDGKPILCGCQSMQYIKKKN